MVALPILQWSPIISASLSCQDLWSVKTDRLVSSVSQSHRAAFAEINMSVSCDWKNQRETLRLNSTRRSGCHHGKPMTFAEQYKDLVGESLNSHNVDKMENWCILLQLQSLKIFCYCCLSGPSWKFTTIFSSTEESTGVKANSVLMGDLLKCLKIDFHVWVLTVSVDFTTLPKLWFKCSRSLFDEDPLWRFSVDSQAVESY